MEAPAASASGPSMAVDDASSSSSSSSSADDLSYAEPIYAGPDKERYEYLDHTADVQIHGCELGTLVCLAGIAESDSWKDRLFNRFSCSSFLCRG